MNDSEKKNLRDASRASERDESGPSVTEAICWTLAAGGLAPVAHFVRLASHHHGNHMLPYGSWEESVVLNAGPAIPILVAVALALPWFRQSTRRTRISAIASIPVLFILLIVLWRLGD